MGGCGHYPGQAMISVVHETPSDTLRTLWCSMTRHLFSRRRTSLGLVLLASLLLSACGESYQELVDQQYRRVAQEVTNLGRYISEGRIRNANLIKRYARIVGRDRPDVKDLADELAKEGTTRGLAYISLTNRLSKINRKPADEKAADAVLEDLIRLEAATDWTVFNDSLIDVVNVLADLSNGRLPRMHIPKSEAKPKEGAGSYLVGNPRYGEWRQNSSGQSFWAWYGQYALFRSLFFGPSTYYYGSWYPGRTWSYYGDVGRHYYGTRSDTGRWNRAGTTYRNTTPRKTYGNLRSQRRLSTYGRTGTRSSGSALRRASAYSSSSRGSSSRGSRGK